MPIHLEELANERSTYAVRVSFFDENGAALTPTAVTWTLSDAVGNIVNSREDVAISPASAITIVLSGADLAITDAYYETTRKLLIEATYTSSLGAGLPFKDEITFSIADFTEVE